MLLSSCATNAEKLVSVIPREHGEFDAISSWKTADIARKWDLEMAEKTCEKIRKTHIVLDEQVAYKGLVAEKPNESVAKVSEVASGVASAVGIWLPAVNLRSKSDYTVGLKFRCE